MVARERAKVELELRDLIAKSELSMYEIARRAGVPYPSILRYIHGQRWLAPHSMQQIAEVLGYELIFRKLKRGKQTSTSDRGKLATKKK